MGGKEPSKLNKCQFVVYELFETKFIPMEKILYIWFEILGYLPFKLLVKKDFSCIIDHLLQGLLVGLHAFYNFWLICIQMSRSLEGSQESCSHVLWTDDCTNKPILSFYFNPIFADQGFHFIGRSKGVFQEPFRVWNLIFTWMSGQGN